jgi:hypothetical protein
MVIVVVMVAMFGMVIYIESNLFFYKLVNIYFFSKKAFQYIYKNGIIKDWNYPFYSGDINVQVKYI